MNRQIATTTIEHPQPNARQRLTKLELFVQPAKLDDLKEELVQWATTLVWSEVSSQSHIPCGGRGHLALAVARPRGPRFWRITLAIESLLGSEGPGARPGKGLQRTLTGSRREGT